MNIFQCCPQCHKLFLNYSNQHSQPGQLCERIQKMKNQLYILQQQQQHLEFLYYQQQQQQQQQHYLESLYHAQEKQYNNNNNNNTSTNNFNNNHNNSFSFHNNNNSVNVVSKRHNDNITTDLNSYYYYHGNESQHQDYQVEQNPSTESKKLSQELDRADWENSIELTPEMIEFLRGSRNRRLNREKEREAEVQQEKKIEHERFLIKKNQFETRKKDMTKLYGEKGKQLLYELEVKTDAFFDKYCDNNNVVYWPSLPMRL